MKQNVSNDVNKDFKCPHGHSLFASTETLGRLGTSLAFGTKRAMGVSLSRVPRARPRNCALQILLFFT